MPDTPSGTQVETGDQSQPTITVVSASQIAESFVGRFPSLTEYGEQLRLVTGLYATYVMSPLGPVTAKEAVADLEAMFSTDLDGVRSAIADLTHCDVSLASAFADEFKLRTGRTFNIKTLNFTGTVQDETGEQREQERLARELADKARAIVTRLPVADRYNQSGAPAKVKRGSLLVGFVNATAAKVTRTPIKRGIEKPQLDWNTEPVLDNSDGGNEEYVKLDRFLDRVIALIEKFASQPNMHDLVLQMLENGRPAIKESDIENSVFRAFELSHETLEQTTQILALVGHDAQYFTDWVDGLKDFRRVYGSVAALFFPAK